MTHESDWSVCLSGTNLRNDHVRIPNEETRDSVLWGGSAIFSEDRGKLRAIARQFLPCRDIQAVTIRRAAYGNQRVVSFLNTYFLSPSRIKGWVAPTSDLLDYNGKPLEGDATQPILGFAPFPSLRSTFGRFLFEGWLSDEAIAQFVAPYPFLGQ